MTQRRRPPERQPQEFANGMRVGGISGALIGGGLFALMGWPWIIVIGATLGAVGGHLWQRWERRSH